MAAVELDIGSDKKLRSSSCEYRATYRKTASSIQRGEVKVSSINQSSIQSMLADPKWSEPALRHIETLDEYIRTILQFRNAQVAIEGRRETVDTTTWQGELTDLDRSRTIKHNAAIASLSTLNRIAEKMGIAPVYADEISEDRPYRSQIRLALVEYAIERLKADGN